MKDTLTIIQIILSLAVTGLILIQAKGTGLGRTFGSQTYHSKRGVESLVFKLTIFLASSFVILSTLTNIFL
jgi:protein translocase SecG subunit